MVGTLTRLARVRVTLLYVGAVVTLTVVLLMSGPDLQDRVIQGASTNLHNLRHGHVETLLASAFVVDAGGMYVWLPGLICLLAVCETLFGSARLVVALVTGHVGSTLLVAAGLVVGLKTGLVSATVTRAEDVGMSYAAMGVLGGVITALPQRWRPVWAGWWLGAALSSALMGRDFTDIGHAVALVLGMVVSAGFGPSGPWTPFRSALLVVGAAFGFLVLASTGPTIVAAAAAGAVAASIGLGWGLIRRAQRNTSALASIQSESHSAGGSSSSSPGISQS
jgi:hypothetical protein